jgi:hypothetical protein
MSWDWSELHTGTIAFLHHKMGWVPLYTSVASMDPETALVFLHLLRHDRPSRASHSREDLEKKTEEQRKRLR